MSIIRKNIVKNIGLLAAVLLASGVVHADVFSLDGTVGNIRQSALTTLQINHSGVVANNCATKFFAYAISTEHPNFKNVYAAVLTAKVAGNKVQIAAYDDQCIDGFPEINVLTIKD